MQVNSLTPDLMVEDVEATVEWYERIFDAEVVATLPAGAETDYWWAQVLVGNAPLMFQERDSLEEKLPDLADEPIGGSVPFYIDVADARELHDELASAGVEIIKSPHETEFGWRQFAATDCNGYVLWFGEKLEDEPSESIGRRYRTYHGDLTDLAASQEEREHVPTYVR